MRHLVSCLVVGALLAILPGAASAQTPTCDGLSVAERAVAEAVLKSQHAYDCCDAKLWDCLQRQPVCRLVTRLANDVCRRAGKGQSQADIERELQRRAASMMPGGKTYTIDTASSARAGDASAPVTVIGYMCARCPYCSRLTPALYNSVTSGKLKGNVQFYLRIFPIRSHKFSTEGALAMQAAHELGQFWPYALHLYSVFNQFDPAKLPDCAASKGMDRQQFIDTMNAASTRAKVVDSKKEGTRNNVNATPTLFIGRLCTQSAVDKGHCKQTDLGKTIGRKYTADLSIGSVEDALEEEWERVTGKR